VFGNIPVLLTSFRSVIAKSIDLMMSMTQGHLPIRPILMIRMILGYLINGVMNYVMNGVMNYVMNGVMNYVMNYVMNNVTNYVT
jgi:hypothetical protein